MLTINNIYTKVVSSKYFYIYKLSWRMKTYSEDSFLFGESLEICPTTPTTLPPFGIPELFPDLCSMDSHDRIQAEIFKYTWNTYPQARRCIWHTPNETKPHPGESKQSLWARIARLKAIGMQPGVLDLVLYHKGVLHIMDVKIGKDHIKPEQQKFIDAICSQGGEFYEIGSIEEGKKIIDRIFGIYK